MAIHTSTTVHSLQSPRIQSNHTSNSKTKNGTVRQGAPPRPPRIHPISNAHQHSPIPQLSKDWEAIPLQYTTRPPQGSPIGIRRETGRGRVFVTRHIKTNTVLEMKVVNLRHAAAFEVENIMAEVAALQRIQARPHRFLIKLPNPKMFDPSIWWSDYGYLYIISQYHPSTLRAYIKNSYVIESCLGFIIGELLLGIDHLHRLGIIHKNISPDNIFIDKEGHCVIGDFDRSVVLPGPANHVILKANRIYNSSSTFVAPELVRYTKDSEKEYIIFDYTVDFFSLGASIYYLVTGELLIERIYAQEPLDSEAVEKKILNMRATGRCPCAVISFVMCLCHINREKRIRMEDALDLAAKTEWMNNIALGTSPLLPLLATPTPEQFPTLSFLSDVSSPNSIDPEKETRCFLDGFHKELYPSRGPLIPHVDISKSPRSGLDFNIPILDGLNLETPVALTSRKKIQRPVAYEKGAVNWHVDDRPMVVPDAGAKGCDTNATESIRSIQYNQAVAHARQPLQLECPNAHTHKQLAGDPNHWQPVSVEVVGITQRSKAKRPEGLLAVGGFGRVFVVQNSKTNRVLVMKIADLIEAHVDEDGSMMDTATNEVVALKRIAKHPNRFTLGLWPESSQDPSIWISETGYLHIVTDYYPNDLADYRHSILPDRTDCIGLIITEVLLGLSHLHNIGIIHGDIKPENIFVDMMGHCVIGDYGGAIVNESAERWEVVPHCRDNYFHTPEYCAPEVGVVRYTATGQHCFTFNEASDLWALGILIYAMLFYHSSEPLGTRVNPNWLKTCKEHMYEDGCHGTIIDFFGKLCQVNLHKRIKASRALQIAEKNNWINLTRSRRSVLLSLKLRRGKDRILTRGQPTPPRGTTEEVEKHVVQFTGMLRGVGVGIPRLEHWKHFSPPPATPVVSPNVNHDSDNDRNTFTPQQCVN